ncbi:MAG: hypothetical protein ACK4PR_04070, partial [Gammaproteobacteria bacterium]
MAIVIKNSIDTSVIKKKLNKGIEYFNEQNGSVDLTQYILTEDLMALKKHQVMMKKKAISDIKLKLDNYFKSINTTLNEAIITRGAGKLLRETAIKKSTTIDNMLN